MSVQLVLLSLTMLAGAKGEDAKKVESRAVKELAPLAGRTAFLFAELTPEGPRPLFASHAEDRFAIGSGFKLFILGRLASEVNEHRRLLENVMRLQPDLIGPPSSELADWPAQSPATLHTLALKMNTISDNTATDHLLHLLGRENVEEHMAKMGHRHPEWNRPMLFTREMVMLRDKADPQRLKTYTQLDEKGRRKFLAEKIAKLHDYERLEIDNDAYDVAEWFAAPMDMAHALNWLHLHAGEKDPAHSLLAILAMNPTLQVDSKVWPYMGGKGGNEEKLMAGNWLFRHRNGKWYTFHVYWNSTEKVDKEPIVKAAQNILTIIEGEIK